jgi:hypothetical protein
MEKLKQEAANSVVHSPPHRDCSTDAGFLFVMVAFPSSTTPRWSLSEQHSMSSVVPCLRAMGDATGLSSAAADARDALTDASSGPLPTAPSQPLEEHATSAIRLLEDRVKEFKERLQKIEKDASLGCVLLCEKMAKLEEEAIRHQRILESKLAQCYNPDGVSAYHVMVPTPGGADPVAAGMTHPLLPPDTSPTKD